MSRLANTFRKLFGAAPESQASATVAKDRLKIMIQQQRRLDATSFEYDTLSRDILDVICVGF